jgi:hypothetical protein
MPMRWRDRTTVKRWRLAGVLVLAAMAAASPQAAAQSASSTALPDWSGVWQMQGGTIFDRASVTPADGRAGDPGVREFPPYNDEWEALYRKNLARVDKGVFPDTISTCGTPAGYPRLLNLPDTYEFAVTRDATWILTENGPNTMRIYTDGRAHPAAEDLWPTYTGASVGRWEGDTLVFTTISMKGSKDGDVIVDRTGLVLSDAARIATRMRKVDDTNLEAVVTIEDPKALEAPWTVTKRFRKMPAGTWVWDYACAENNRNPIAGSGRTLTIGPDGKPLDKVVD